MVIGASGSFNYGGARDLKEKQEKYIEIHLKYIVDIKLVGKHV